MSKELVAQQRDNASVVSETRIGTAFVFISFPNIVIDLFRDLSFRMVKRRELQEVSMLINLLTTVIIVIIYFNLVNRDADLLKLLFLVEKSVVAHCVGLEVGNLRLTETFKESEIV